MYTRSEDVYTLDKIEEAIALVENQVDVKMDIITAGEVIRKTIFLEEEKLNSFISNGLQAINEASFSQLLFEPFKEFIKNDFERIKDRTTWLEMDEMWHIIVSYERCMQHYRISVTDTDFYIYIDGTSTETEFNLAKQKISEILISFQNDQEVNSATITSHAKGKMFEIKDWGLHPKVRMGFDFR